MTTIIDKVLDILFDKLIWLQNTQYSSDQAQGIKILRIRIWKISRNTSVRLDGNPNFRKTKTKDRKIPKYNNGCTKRKNKPF